MLVPFSCSQQSSLSKKAVLLFYTGNVKIQDKTGKIKTTAIKSIITQNDTIITGKNSSAVIQINKVGMIRILSSSTILFKSILDRSEGTNIFLKSGSVYSKINKSKNYRVGTKTITAAIRGTRFLTTYKKNTSKVLLGTGIVKMSLNKKKENSWTLTKGNSAIFTDKPDPQIKPLKKVEILQLKKLAVPEEIDNPSNISIEKLKEKFSEYSEKESIIQKDIDTEINRWNSLSPVEKLREQGKVLSKITLRDKSVIIGSIVSQNSAVIRLDTGDGIIRLPKRDIIRRQMIK